MRGDVSFTFLHRVEEVESNIADGRWQSVLALALTLPDICGGIAFPEIVKRYRDGRVMLDRQKNPTRDVGGQYIRWFDEFAGEYFKLSPSDETPYICGERCWQLRCEYLHQNKGFLNDENESTVRFHLGVNCGTSVCQLDQTTIHSDGMDIRIDIEQFCLRMCQAARSYYNAVHKEKDFSLYNTPVLDFIQATSAPVSSATIALLSGNKVYAKGLQQALTQVSEGVILFHTPTDVRKYLGKRKPALWIVTEDMAKQPDQPWRSDKTTTVIFITRDKVYADGIIKNPGKLILLEMPISLNILRDSVRNCLP